MSKIKLIYGLEASAGGALKHLVYLVTRLNKNEFDIVVMLSCSRKYDVKEEVEKMKYVGAKVLIIPMCRNISFIKDFYSLLRLIVFLGKSKFDVLHAHSSKAGGIFRLAAWICRVPVVYYTPHCFYFQGKSGIRKSLFLFLEKLLARITTNIIVSESEQKEIIKNKLTKISKVININNAIDFNEYQNNKEVYCIKKKTGIDKNAFVVGSIGRLTPQKDWETYIYAANEVLQKHPETVFLIVGEGELYNEIQKLIFKLNLIDRVIVTGFIKEIHKIYGIIDVYVNTSLWEGLPYVFLEAMKYKKPIIATDTGNDTTIIHKETGFISPVKDYRAIADKIITLIENKQMTIKMGEKGNDMLNLKYSFERFIQKHEELYHA